MTGEDRIESAALVESNEAAARKQEETMIWHGLIEIGLVVGGCALGGPAGCMMGAAAAGTMVYYDVRQSGGGNKTALLMAGVAMIPGGEFEGESAGALARPGVGDVPRKVVNSNMGHVDVERAGRAGYSSVQDARAAVRSLGDSIETDGFPEGTIPDSARSDRVLVPIGDNGYAVYQIAPNGNAVFKTILTQTD